MSFFMDKIIDRGTKINQIFFMKDRALHSPRLVRSDSHAARYLLTFSLYDKRSHVCKNQRFRLSHAISKITRDVIIFSGLKAKPKPTTRGAWFFLLACPVETKNAKAVGLVMSSSFTTA